MKKTVSLLLAVCMCLSVGVMLTSCGGGEHTHTYKTEWSKDAAHHWHACEGEACTEVADKAEHAWNDGEVTTPPTAEANGVKTVTCTVCGQTKTETLEYVPDTTVTQEEWRSALAKENFYNVTLLYSDYRYNEESENAKLSYTTQYEYDGDLMRNDGSKAEENSGDMDTEEVFGMVGRALEHYADAAYDEEAQQYFLMLYDDYYEMMFGFIYRFADGKLTHFEFHFLQNGTTDEMYKSRWMEWKFSNYGTTVITESTE